MKDLTLVSVRDPGFCVTPVSVGQRAPPDSLSFKQAVNTVRRKLPNYGAISP